jgi:hypothetical protein
METSPNGKWGSENWVRSVEPLARDLLLAAEAEPLLRECLPIREKTQPNVWSTFNTKSILRRDAEIRALREEMQRARRISPPLQEGRGDNLRQAVSTRRKGE